MLKSIALVGVVAASVAAGACSSTSSPVAPSVASAPITSEDAATGRSSLPTIAALAAGNSDFSTLVYALQEAGLVSEFDGSQNYTVFAPTNAAFEAAAAAFKLADGPALIDYLKGENLLAPVLLYHVSRGSRNSTGVVSAGQVLMLDGNRATISSGQGVKIDNAAIVAVDVRASNGYIHVIDAVLLPPSLR